jgi:heme exporter protein A
MRAVFREVDVAAHGGDCLGLVGPNGSGKSTLLKVLGRLLRPDAGSLTLTVNGKHIDDPLPITGLVAPWLNVYDEFTPIELMELQARMHGVSPDGPAINETLDRLALGQRGSDVVRSLSSGLRQRVLLALAVQLNPTVLLLDEPTTTLDAEGRALVRSEIERHRLSGGVVILATNDPEEQQWCTSTFTMPH